MADFLELIETIRAEDASTDRLFESDLGVSVRSRRNNPRYTEMLAEAIELIADVSSGRRPMHRLAEAMTTSDFPYLFGDVLDRQLLARYNEYPQSYRSWVRVSEVRDFRTVKRFALDGGEAHLDVVPEETEYPAAALTDTFDSYAVQKRGRRFKFSWEAYINDDLGALTDNPDRLARAARRSESRFATSLYVGTTGPDGTLYTSGHKNIVTGNPALSIAALQTALTVLHSMLDDDGEPIYIDTVTLVVPPALQVTAENILHSTQIITAAGSGSSTTDRLIAANWMNGRVKLEVDPFIPALASSSNGNTSWFLFGDPNTDRPALEIGFLRGHTTPELFMKASDSIRVGGAEANPMDGDFETDSVQLKVRHVFGGTQLNTTKGFKTTVASNGSGV